MRLKCLIAGTAAIVVLAGLGGCSEDTTPVADESPGGGSATSDPVESEPADEESESTDPEEESGGYDADELLAAMKAAVMEHKSSHITMSMTGIQSLTGEGDVSYAGDNTAMQLSMTMPQLGTGEVEVRLVDGVIYMAMPPMTPEGKFIEFDTNDPNSPFGDLGGITQGDPMSTFEAFEAGLRKVTYVGEEGVDGEDMDHYVLSVDARKAAKAQGTELPPGAPDEVSYDLWLDDEDLMRRMEFTQGTGGMTMTMSDWGKPVSIEAPPASAIMQMPGSMG